MVITWKRGIWATWVKDVKVQVAMQGGMSAAAGWQQLHAWIACE
jgi:hypothetical protein